MHLFMYDIKDVSIVNIYNKISMIYQERILSWHKMINSYIDILSSFSDQTGCDIVLFV